MSIIRNVVIGGIPGCTAPRGELEADGYEECPACGRPTDEHAPPIPDEASAAPDGGE